MQDPYDIVIVGGGMIGASLSAALMPLGLKVALLESVSPAAEHQPSFDERTTALSNGSRQVLTGIGVWSEIAAQAAPIHRIHVSDQGRFGFARIDAAEQGLNALGYVLPNRVLGAALWARLQTAGGPEVLCPATVRAVEAGADVAQVTVVHGAEERRLTAKLVVAADGAHSVVRQALGIAASQWEYGQTAVITNVATARFHNHTAYERFTPTGPLAVLPLTPLPAAQGHDAERNRCGVIWTLEPQAAQAVMQLSDAQFLEALQDKFGWRLGRLARLGKRFAYPLALTQAEERIERRCVIIGNAAQGLHPIAGQGFNLGLRDVATLAEVIAENRAAIGSAAMLARYEEWRGRDRRSIVAFTDGLVRVFGSPLASLSTLRNLGLLAFDVLPPAKRALSRLSMGFASRLPKLTRGVPLS